MDADQHTDDDTGGWSSRGGWKGVAEEEVGRKTSEPGEDEAEDTTTTTTTRPTAQGLHLRVLHDDDDDDDDAMQAEEEAEAEAVSNRTGAAWPTRTAAAMEKAVERPCRQQRRTTAPFPPSLPAPLSSPFPFSLPHALSPLLSPSAMAQQSTVTPPLASRSRSRKSKRADSATITHTHTTRYAHGTQRQCAAQPQPECSWESGRHATKRLGTMDDSERERRLRRAEVDDGQRLLLQGISAMQRRRRRLPCAVAVCCYLTRTSPALLLLPSPSVSQLLGVYRPLLTSPTPPVTSSLCACPWPTCLAFSHPRPPSSSTLSLPSSVPPCPPP